jgi:DNA-binding XRE family transcriptional regulator
MHHLVWSSFKVAETGCTGDLDRKRSFGYLSLMVVSPDQIRAARALLRIEQAELAERAHVSVVTIRRIETLNARERVAAKTFDGIQRALEPEHP